MDIINRRYLNLSIGEKQIINNVYCGLKLKNRNDSYANIISLCSELTKICKATVRKIIEEFQENSRDMEIATVSRRVLQLDLSRAEKEKISIEFQLQHIFNNMKRMNRESEPAEEKRFEKLLFLMLDSQTQEKMPAIAKEKLRQHGCSVEKILKISEDDLVKLLFPVCYPKIKAKMIKTIARILKEKYNGDIPSTVEELCLLPGISPEVAQKCLGIEVDTNVHRVANRLGLVQTETFEETKTALEKILHREYWEEASQLLVEFGQQICTLINPSCLECLNAFTCKYAQNAGEMLV